MKGYHGNVSMDCTLGGHRTHLGQESYVLTWDRDGQD